MNQIVSLALEQGEERLAHDGGIGIIHLAEKQIPAHGFIALISQQAIDQHHLAEGGGRFCQGQGGVEGKQAVTEGQHAVDGVPQLMGHRSDIIRFRPGS